MSVALTTTGKAARDYKGFHHLADMGSSGISRLLMEHPSSMSDLCIGKTRTLRCKLSPCFPSFSRF